MSRYVLWAAAFGIYSVTQQVDAKPLDIRLCYEDKEVVPFYVGAGQAVPKQNPGANIEILLAMQASANVNFEFVRRPWMRCWDLLANNEVDAIIASYRHSRADELRYPQNEGKPDPTRALSGLGTCFVATPAFHEFWPKRHKPENQPLSIALPHGYAVAEKLKKEPVLLHRVFSQKDGFRLLDNGRVEAVLGVCEINGQQVQTHQSGVDGVKPMYPPFEHLHGYLAFRPHFYSLHDSQIEALWDAIGEFDSTDTYLQYLQYNAMEE